jgi:hypothetical protein
MVNRGSQRYFEDGAPGPGCLLLRSTLDEEFDLDDYEWQAWKQPSQTLA